jgi:hypothetical protein
MDENRKASRKRVLKAGAIEFSSGGAISCIVKNLSATGAALEVQSPMDIPDRFKLVVQADGLNQACHVVWRKERRIGVTFD